MKYCKTTESQKERMAQEKEERGFVTIPATGNQKRTFENNYEFYVIVEGLTEEEEKQLLGYYEYEAKKSIGRMSSLLGDIMGKTEEIRDYYYKLVNGNFGIEDSGRANKSDLYKIKSYVVDWGCQLEPGYFDTLEYTLDTYRGKRFIEVGKDWIAKCDVDKLLKDCETQKKFIEEHSSWKSWKMDYEKNNDRKSTLERERDKVKSMPYEDSLTDEQKCTLEIYNLIFGEPAKEFAAEYTLDEIFDLAQKQGLDVKDILDKYNL